MTPKPLLIVGLAASGISAARFVSKFGLYKPFVVESKSSSEIDQKLLCELKQLNIPLHCSVVQELPHELSSIGFELAVLSPGVAPNGKFASTLKRAGIELISELELGLRYRTSPAVIVTGSNGKSTTTALIAHILQHSGRSAHACGNLGTPLCQVLYNGIVATDWLVIEASSYQLELTSSLGVQVGVFINLSENHLERHGDMSAYFDAKARLFYGSDAVANVAVINVDDPFGARLSKLASGELRLISDPEQITGNLIGRHNHYNVALAFAATEALGLSSAEIRKAVATFQPLEHRLERLNPHFIINDSKATTVAAAQAGVRAVLDEFPTRQLCLLLGGKAKRGSWQPLFSLLQAHKMRLSRLICFGADGAYLSQQAHSSGLANLCFESLEAAVEHACHSLKGSEVVLLSPGCASFDQFSNFEERGQVFKSLIAKFMAAL